MFWPKKYSGIISGLYYGIYYSLEDSERGIASYNSNGLAVYLPERFFLRSYGKLKWADDSKWDEFIDWLLKK